MDSSFRFDSVTINWDSPSDHTYIGVSGYNFTTFIKENQCCILLSEDPNSVDPDEMQHHVVSHLGLHCLQKYLFRGFPFTKG